jgi:hypothetical protein
MSSINSSNNSNNGSDDDEPDLTFLKTPNDRSSSSYLQSKSGKATATMTAIGGGASSNNPFVDVFHPPTAVDDEMDESSLVSGVGVVRDLEREHHERQLLHHQQHLLHQHSLSHSNNSSSTSSPIASSAPTNNNNDNNMVRSTSDDAVNMAVAIVKHAASHSRGVSLSSTASMDDSPLPSPTLPSQSPLLSITISQSSTSSIAAPVSVSSIDNGHHDNNNNGNHGNNAHTGATSLTASSSPPLTPTRERRQSSSSTTSTPSATSAYAALVSQMMAHEPLSSPNISTSSPSLIASPLLPSSAPQSRTSLPLIGSLIDSKGSASLHSSPVLQPVPNATSTSPLSQLSLLPTASVTKVPIYAIEESTSPTVAGTSVIDSNSLFIQTMTTIDQLQRCIHVIILLSSCQVPLVPR